MKVVFLHGFTQTARSWDQTISTMSTEVMSESRAVDLPGHGDNSNGRVGAWDIADALAAEHGVAIYVGYSFGARVALHIACRHPDKVKGLILVSGSPGIADPSERSVRADADNELATHIETVGVEAFIDEWLSNPLFKTLDPEKSQRVDRCRNSARGLADSLRYAGTGRQDSLWHQLPSVAAPTLLVSGQLDDKFCEIASQMSAMLPTAQWVTVDNAGHTVHLEKPERFVVLLNTWLKATFSD